MTMPVRLLRRNSSICIIYLMNLTHLRGYVFICKSNIRIRKSVKRIIHNPFGQFDTFGSFGTVPTILQKFADSEPDLDSGGGNPCPFSSFRFWWVELRKLMCILPR